LTIKNEFGLADKEMFGPREKYYLAYRMQVATGRSYDS
jgi:hypothetical protein